MKSKVFADNGKSINPCTKEKLLDALCDNLTDCETNLSNVNEKNENQFLSGEVLGTKLDVSRTAIWKAAKSLVSDGYAVECVSSKGYKLNENKGRVAKKTVLNKLGKLANNFQIFTYDTCSSTNDVAKDLAHNGCAEFTTIISDEQTKGRGRRGRTFYSPKGSGLYISLVLRPTSNLKNSLDITAMAAVAAAESIEKVSGLKTEIKWVNDVYIGGKKAVGILTEANIDLESGTLSFAVVGTGFNLFVPDGGFPKEIADSATAIFSDSQTVENVKSKLVAEYLTSFYRLYNSSSSSEYFNEYLSRSAVIGKEVWIIAADGTKTAAKAISIDNDFSLNVELLNGEIEKLTSGEVSLRFKHKLCD